MASDRPIFVVGCGRSGTTLLRVMLHAHPRIALPPETSLSVDAYRRRRSFGDLRAADNRAALARWIVERRESRPLRLDADALVEEIVAGPPSVGSAVGITLAAYARRYGKARWGEKQPNYIRHVPTLRQLFPDAQFVHIVRDGRDVVASLRRMDWFAYGDLSALSSWARAVDLGDHYRRSLPADTWYELRYEQLVADPEGELRRLCDYLGEEFVPRMARPQKVAKRAVTKRGLREHHAGLQAPVTASRVGNWRTGLDATDAALVQQACADRLRRHGYELSDDLPRARPVDLVRYRGVDLTWRLLQRGERALDALRGVGARGPGAAALPPVSAPRGR